MEEKQDRVFGEFPKILIGDALVYALMILVFLLIGKLDLSVILGGLLGTAVNFLCFFILCLSVDKMIRDGDPVKAKNTQMISYFLRLAIMAGCIVLAYKVDIFYWVAAIIPLLTTRPILSVCTLIQSKREAKKK